MSVIAVTGLAREARIARGARTVPVIGSGDAQLLTNRLEEAIRAGAKGIISFGIAGALAPLLRPGDVVIATHVVHGEERYATDPKWTAVLRQKLPRATPAIIVGHGEIVSHVDGKRRLFALSGAHAVDTESHIAARIARRHGIPFAAIRTISDAATRGLPPAALIPLKPNGRIRLGGVLRSVMSDPRQIPDLITTGREAGKAFRALLRCRNALGLGLGFPYLG
ncbi:MAG: phosphorylase family protein [Rhizomicrobium sp.]|jgi:adenosylhomocysteine nucleosidase